MRKLLIAAFCSIIFAACQTSSSQDNSTDTKELADTSAVAAADAPKVEVEKAVHEFGTITQGEKISYEFKFKNTGKTPLIITDASATCGCTVPEYPNTPIKPGESGIIKVIFDSAGKLGLQDKVITISSNANPKFEELHLVGDILEKK